MGNNSCVKQNKKGQDQYYYKNPMPLIKTASNQGSIHSNLTLQTTFSSKLSRIMHEETATSFTDIRQVYNFDAKIIGRGHYGVVRKAWNKMNPGKIYAVKTMSKKKLKQDLYLLKRELAILKTLDHPNIIKLFEVYQDENFFHLVMEFCGGGELFQRIVSKKRFGERQAVIIMKKICSAVNYLHENGIVHRDLKPENFIFADDSDDAEIKLIDFGLSNHYFQQFTTLKSIVGTALYVAPEVWRGQYTNKCDMWSVGVIAYVLLSGNPPFIGNNQKEVLFKANHQKIDLNTLEWKELSKRAKNFISKLIVVDEEFRMNSQQTLQHPWLKKEVKDLRISYKKIRRESRIDRNIMNLVKNFNPRKSRLKQEALRVILELLKEEQIDELRHSFRQLDRQNSGLLKFSQVRQVLKQSGLEKIESILATLPENEYISYSEFLAASVDLDQLDTGVIKQAFRYFDVDNTNFISQDNLVEAMARTGKKLPETEILGMLKEADFMQNNQISYEEFHKFIQPQKINKENGLQIEPNEDNSLGFDFYFIIELDISSISDEASIVMPYNFFQK